MKDKVTLSEKCIELANHVVDDPDEPAATIRGGGFIGIVNNVVGKFDTLLAEGYFVPHIARWRPNTTEFPISPAAVYRFNKAPHIPSGTTRSSDTPTETNALGAV